MGMDKSIENQLYRAAVELIEKRYPEGWGGAAAIRISDGRILTSVAPDTKNDALALCMEVGACLEAHKLGLRVTHSLCLCRESHEGDFLILTPCGICQERLRNWGKDVRVAISNSENNLIFKRLDELMPHHWSLVNQSPPVPE